MKRSSTYHLLPGYDSIDHSMRKRSYMLLGWTLLNGILFITFFWHAGSSTTFLSSSSSTKDPLLSPTSKLPKLHLLFPLDERSHGPRSCKAFMAAAVHGYEPTILNWDFIGTREQLYAAKIPGVYNYIDKQLKNAKEEELVLMADTYDIWFQNSPRALIRRFRELNAKVVIGADSYCWPNDPESVECKAAPPSTVPMGVFDKEEPPRFANSGTVMGKVQDMRDLYQQLNESLAERPWENDQTFFIEMYPAGQMLIDYWYRLWWTTAGPKGPHGGAVINIKYPIDGSDDGVIPYHLLPPIIYHVQSGEIPVALHWNADDSKYQLEEMFGKLWWGRPEKRFREIVLDRLNKAKIHFAHDGSTRSYWDVCPPSILDLGPTLPDFD